MHNNCLSKCITLTVKWRELIPEWEGTGEVTLELRRPTGDAEKIARDLPIALTGLHLR
jgi:hypothetical protein